MNNVINNDNIFHKKYYILIGKRKLIIVTLQAKGRCRVLASLSIYLPQSDLPLMYNIAKYVVANGLQ